MDSRDRLTLTVAYRRIARPVVETQSGETSPEAPAKSVRICVRNRNTSELEATAQKREVFGRSNKKSVSAGGGRAHHRRRLGNSGDWPT